MEEKKIVFDPFAWVNKSEGNVAANGSESLTVKNTPEPMPQCQPPSPADELAKATAVADELLLRGASIAESYDDYLQLGFALANGLGASGGELYHRLCAQSAKYRQGDCERKWQECLRKQDGRTTIATFYKMAQDAGVDIAAVFRQFSADSAIPHGSASQYGVSGKCVSVGTELSDNNNDTLSKSAVTAIAGNVQHSGAELRNLRKTEPADKADECERRFAYSETFSDKLVPGDIPSLLQDVMDTQHDAESRDKVGIAALILLSGAMPNVEGVYDEKRVSAELYAILNAPSGIANKGAVEACRQLVMPIEWDIRHQQEEARHDYERQLSEWQSLKPSQRKGQQEPKEPKYQSLFIAANSSAPVVYEDLGNNGGRGIIFETEADTLANVQQQEWGQWSDLMRKSFHHERVTLSRKNENTRIVIDHPRLAVLLTCTPGQIPQLLPATQVENGLANRFLFYCLRGRRGWRSPFKGKGEPLEVRMFGIGQRFYKLYQVLNQRSGSPLEFTFSQEQKDRFDDFFAPLYDEQTGMNGDELSAFIFRLGLSTFRMAMVLTVLRCAERQPMFKPESNVLVCSDADFRSALTIANTLINHTCHVYANLLPHAGQPQVAGGVKMDERQKKFLQALPDEFTTALWKSKADALNISRRTAEGYLGNFINKHHLVVRIRNGHFRKA